MRPKTKLLCFQFSTEMPKNKGQKVGKSFFWGVIFSSVVTRAKIFLAAKFQQHYQDTEVRKTRVCCVRHGGNTPICSDAQQESELNTFKILVEINQGTQRK